MIPSLAHVLLKRRSALSKDSFSLTFTSDMNFPPSRCEIRLLQMVKTAPDSPFYHTFKNYTQKSNNRQYRESHFVRKILNTPYLLRSHQRSHNILIQKLFINFFTYFFLWLNYLFQYNHRKRRYFYGNTLTKTVPG